MTYRSRGQLVVKLAGLAGGIGLYEEEMQAAAGAGYRVAALDTSGDRSDDPVQEPLTWDALAEEVASAIEGDGASRAILWGTSFGCLVALAAAARHPDRVAGLLLAHPPDPRRRPHFHGRLRAWADGRGDPVRATRALFSLWFLGLTAWEGLMPPLWGRLPALAHAAREAATPPAVVRRKLEILFAGEPGLPPREVPVEIIAGAWDLVAPLSGVEALAARIPQARVHVMRWSGHAGAYTRPSTYRETAIGALRRLADAPPC